MYGFDVTFFKRFWKVLLITFPTIKSITALLFGAMIAFVILEQVVINQVGLIPSKYYQVLGSKDLDGFKNHTIKAILIVAAMAVIRSTKNYVASVFYVSSRGRITEHLHKIYFSDIIYYQLNVVENSIDNPDQRITQDVNKMCKTFSEIVPSLIIAPFTIAYYTYQTWKSTGYLGPVTVFLFFVVFTISNKLLMSSVVRLVYKQEQQEGDFRCKHMNVRSNAESAGFYRCGKIELYKTNQRLHQLLNTQQHLNLRQFLLSLSISFADYLGSILSYIMLAIPLFAGVYDQLSPSELSQLISQNAFITIYLIFSFTKLIDMAGDVADMAGTTHRIMQLAERMDELKRKMKELNSYSKRSSLTDSSSSSGGGNECTGYSLENVSYKAPGENGSILVSGLNLEIKQNVNILITGDSGCGKSSLLRVLDGLWSPIRGKISRNIDHDRYGVLYLPQKPFLTNGTLRQQICFPYAVPCDPDLSDEELRLYIIDLSLENLITRTGGLDCPCDWNWYDVLSPGEMQRISFLRLFYHQTKFAVLDEATSQISQSMERHLYELCSSLNITLISVGHRDTIRQYHQVELRLDGEGGWRIFSIDGNTTSGCENSASSTFQDSGNTGGAICKTSTSKTLHFQDSGSTGGNKSGKTSADKSLHKQNSDEKGSSDTIVENLDDEFSIML